MSKIKINPDYCKGCLVCVEFCPKNVLKPSESINAKGYIQPETDDPAACIDAVYARSSARIWLFR